MIFGTGVVEQMQFIRRLWAHVKTIKFSDWLMVAFTGVIAFYASLQYKAMEGAGEQTDKLIEAAGIQAKAANRAAEAAERFADTAKRADEKIRLAERDFEKMASSASQSLKTTQESMRLDQRAWVTSVGVSLEAVQIGKPLACHVFIVNSGKTVAKQVTVLFHLQFFPEPINPAHLEHYTPNTNLLETSVGVLSPNSRYDNKYATAEPTTAINKNDIESEWYTYVWGDIRYRDIFNREHLTQMCNFRKGTEGDFVQCPFHNDAD